MEMSKKHLIRICYPLLMAIPIYLIYDTDDFSYISVGVTLVGAWGIGATFVYFSKYYENEPRSLREYLNNPLKLRILYVFPWVSLILFLWFLIYPVPLISGPFIYLLYLLDNYVIMGMIEFFMLTIVLLIYYCNRKAKVIYPIQRTFEHYFTYSFLIYSILVYMYVLYDLPDNQNTSFLEKCIACSAPYILFGPVAVFDRKEIFYVVIPKVNFCLFLRPFGLDKTENINSVLALFGKENIVQIANPVLRKSDDSFIGYNLFLPTRKWKKELRYYISKARHIYCIIGESEGVQWEMFENEDVCEKFIYHIPFGIDLDNIISLNKDNEGKSLILNCLQGIRNKISANECVFFIRNGQCYCYNDPYLGVESFLSSCPNTRYGCVKFPVSVSNELNISAENKKYMRFSYFKDILRLYSMIMRPRKVVFYLGLLVLIPVTIAYIVFPLCLLFLSAVGLFMCVLYILVPNFAADIFGFSNNIGVFDIVEMMVLSLIIGYIGYVLSKSFWTDA